jgi:hypothetical protein
VWAAVNAAGGPEAAALTHFPAVLDPAWLAALPLPDPDALPPGHTVSMPGPAEDGFEHHADPATVRAAYQRRPRTQIITDIGWNDRVPWAAHAGRHLTRLAGTSPRIVIAVYHSAHGDEELGAHTDTWTGVVIQTSGAKTWQAGHHPASTITVTAGDILIIPKYLPHTVTTPPRPGHSTHLVFAINRDLTTST